MPGQQGAILLQNSKDNLLALIKQNGCELLGRERELQASVGGEFDVAGHQVGIIGQGPVIGLLREISRHRDGDTGSQQPGQRQGQQDMPHQAIAQEGLGR